MWGWINMENTLIFALFLSFHQSTVPQPTFSMPVTVPVSNQNAAAAAALQFSNNPSGALVTTTSFVTSTLTDPRLLSPQQPALQRNTVSPGLPQRPASAGKKRHEQNKILCFLFGLTVWTYARIINNLKHLLIHKHPILIPAADWSIQYRFSICSSKHWFGFVTEGSSDARQLMSFTFFENISDSFEIDWRTKKTHWQNLKNFFKR